MNGKIMQRVIGTTFMTAFAFACAFQASAQKPERLSFAKNKSSTTVTATTGTLGKTYVLRAKAGQKLILTLSPASRVGIKVEIDGRFGQMVLLREEKGGIYEVGLEESGDYTIFVGSTTRKPVQFALSVKIGKLADI